MSRRPIAPSIWLVLGTLLLCGAGWSLQPARWRPAQQADLLTHNIYAYRQWQSTGIWLMAGDTFQVRASGQWQYSPLVGLHGPRGGRPAVDSYPLPSAAGGALIGRLGESGEPFYVGARAGGVALPTSGLLYLRINDDLLGDNRGQLRVEIDVERAPATPSP